MNCLQSNDSAGPENVTDWLLVDADGGLMTPGLEQQETPLDLIASLLVGTSDTLQLSFSHHSIPLVSLWVFSCGICLDESL